jgi:hypothetical protein
MKGIGGWRERDSVFTNYVGHPLMGAAAGWIYLHNDPRGVGRRFSADGGYWHSRLRAMAWSGRLQHALRNRPGERGQHRHRGDGAGYQRHAACSTPAGRWATCSA